MPSSVIRAYRYDAAENRLIIEFTSGETYSYFRVPEAIVAGLRQAMSKGRYFQRHIRDRFDYRHERTHVS